MRGCCGTDGSGSVFSCSEDGSRLTAPRERILAILHEALGQTRSESDELVQRLTSIYRDEEQPESSEQVVALGFLACARALREASLIQEIAIREEIQELDRLITEVLTEVKRTEKTVRGQTRQGRRRGGSLVSDLSPARPAADD